MFPFIYLTCLVHVVIHIRYISIQQLIWLSFQPSFTHYQFFLIVEDYLVIASLTIINRWSVKYKGQIASKICIVYFIVLRMFILAIKNLKFYLKYLFQIKPLLNKHWKLKLGGLYTSFGATMHLISYCCTENATCTKIAFSSTFCYWNKPCHEIQIYSKITIKKKVHYFFTY